jgi:hypothetical protein
VKATIAVADISISNRFVFGGHRFSASESPVRVLSSSDFWFEWKNIELIFVSVID